jgi:hypothetical protein
MYIVWLWNSRYYFSAPTNVNFAPDRSKEMYVHVSACTYYDFKLCGISGSDKMCVFIHLVAKMRDRILEQTIHIKFLCDSRK